MLHAVIVHKRKTTPSLLCSIECSIIIFNSTVCGAVVNTQFYKAGGSEFESILMWIIYRNVQPESGSIQT